jgi:hypothetical protein
LRYAPAAFAAGGAGFSKRYLTVTVAIEVAEPLGPVQVIE